MDTKKIIKDSYPSSEKIYIPGKLFPIQVGMRKINLTDTVTVENGKRIHTPNAPVYVYDTSGPYTDPDITVDIDKGLPRLRESWITARGDVERQDDITSKYGRARRDDPSLDPIRFKNTPLPLQSQTGTCHHANVLCPTGNRHGRNGICRHTGKLAKRTIRH